MQLNTNRFFSNRVVFDHSLDGKLRVANSFFDWCQRIIAWVWAPSSYSDENRRTISCFTKYLIDRLGADRLQRICSRYSLDLDQMEKKGSPLLSRDVAKIVIGTQSLNVADINDFLLKAQGGDDPRFIGKSSFADLDPSLFAEVCASLQNSLGNWQVEEIRGEPSKISGRPGKISGRPTEQLSNFYFDPFLADRERLKLVKEHPLDHFETFVHNMVARVIKREMEVGTLIPAPNNLNNKFPQFYYVSAKVVTGKGIVSYLVHPASKDTDLKPMRLFRGTSPRNSDLDAISTMITDLEKDLGRSAYESGIPYDTTISEILSSQGLTVPEIEAGHSLGSTIAQYRLANTNHVKTAYLYCGPGLPEQEVEKFNKKTSPVHLVIRKSKNDPFSKLGGVHIGYQAPENVIVEFLKYHGPKKKLGQNPHITVWGKEKYYHGVEGGISPYLRDLRLYNKNRRSERIRSLLGPFAAVPLRFLRSCVRILDPNSRVNKERGLKIGVHKNGAWQVEHFRAM